MKVGGEEGGERAMEMQRAGADRAYRCRLKQRGSMGFQQEMALQSRTTEPVGNASLEGWEPVGSGGFGLVYKARHTDWGFDVAVKILRDGVSPPFTSKERALWEATHMETASCEFVLRVYGIYEGVPPVRGTSVQQGIVMEFMGGGSVQSLQRDLPGPPPWALAFRLAHQVALGMNFLHSRNLMHHDLKPSNVLLNDNLNAKLADFGLCRVSTSALSSTREATGAVGGSYKYMPPEAFKASYEPVRAFDVYSFGILLWSILTGKEPYPLADYVLVELKIPLGDRPPSKEIDQMRAEGLKELVDLMENCWDENPSKRPTFKECLTVTEKVLLKHKKGIHDAVHEVLTKLESKTSNQHSNISVPFRFSPQIPEQSKSNDSVDCVRITKTERSLIQDSANVPPKRMSDKDKAKFVDDNRAVLIQDVSEVMAIAEELGAMVHRETYSVIEAKETSQDKMRVLYQRTLRSGGVVVKAAFFDILKTHQPQIMERLGG